MKRFALEISPLEDRKVENLVGGERVTMWRIDSWKLPSGVAANERGLVALEPIGSDLEVSTEGWVNSSLSIQFLDIHETGHGCV